MTVVVVAPLRVAGEMAVLRIRPAATLPDRRASGQVLASVKTTPGFRCGLEFTNLSEEIAFLAHRGVALDGIEQEVHADPGELLIFDNQLVAHGRRGSRQPGELHQRVIGHQHAPPDQQRAIRDRFLTAFA